MLYSADAWPGRIYKLTLDGKLLGMFGESGKQLKQFGWIHALACPLENVLWVGELLNWRAQKLLLHPYAEFQAGRALRDSGAAPVNRTASARNCVVQLRPGRRAHL